MLRRKPTQMWSVEVSRAPSRSPRPSPRGIHTSQGCRRAGPRPGVLRRRAAGTRRAPGTRGDGGRASSSQDSAGQPTRAAGAPQQAALKPPDSGLAPVSRPSRGQRGGDLGRVREARGAECSPPSLDSPPNKLTQIYVSNHHCFHNILQGDECHSFSSC